MIHLKPGVKVDGIRPELMLGLIVSASVYSNSGYDLTVTSIKDGKHSRTSLHYAGQAADLRIRGIDPDKWQHITDRIQTALGHDYDVILEADHIHLEYQPKGPHTPGRHSEDHRRA